MPLTCRSCLRSRVRSYQNETTPILAYYEHQGLTHKINGARDVEEVWADTTGAIGAIEERFTAAQGGQLVCAHVYANADGAPSSAELQKRVAKAASARFGAEKVAVTSRAFAVERSLKAFGIDAVPAFD